MGFIQGASPARHDSWWWIKFSVVHLTYRSNKLFTVFTDGYRVTFPLNLYRFHADTAISKFTCLAFFSQRALKKNKRRMWFAVFALYIVTVLLIILYLGVLLRFWVVKDVFIDSQSCVLSESQIAQVVSRFMAIVFLFSFWGQKNPIVPFPMLFNDDLPIVHGLPGPLHGSLNLRECIYVKQARERQCFCWNISWHYSIPLDGTAWRKIQIPDLRNLSKSHFALQEGQVHHLIPGDQHPT